MINRKKLKRDLKQAVERKRRRDEAAKPCPDCGGTSPLAGGFAQVRITDPNQGLCATCERVAANNGLMLVEMWPPRGLDGPDAA